MEILYTPTFEKTYRKSERATKELAKKQEQIFRANPFDKRLKTHKLQGRLKEFWSFSVTHSVRIVFEFVDSDIVVFHDIGNHDIYNK